MTFIQLISTFLYFLRFSKDVNKNFFAVTALSLFPQMSFNMAISNIAFRDDRQFGPEYDFDFSYQRANITMAASFVVFTILAVYLN